MSQPDYFTGGKIFSISKEEKTYILTRNDSVNCYHHQWRWFKANLRKDKRDPEWVPSLNVWIIHETETKLDLALALESGAMLCDTNPSLDRFKGYRIERYKRGYKLIGTDEFGKLYVPYFNNGWLLSYDKAPNEWFVRKEFRDYFIYYGASFSLNC